MFRRHQHLLRDGAQAQAVVTDAQRSGGHTAIEGGTTAVQYRLELRIHFPDGSTADASCRVGGALVGTGLWFYPGDIVPVRYDSDDRSKVAVDEPALKAQRDAELKANEDAAVARAERRLAGLPEPTSTEPLPTDAELQFAYQAWRSAIRRTKQSKAAHKRAEASGDRAETLRAFHQSVTRSAEEKSARAKFDRLHKLRPDWTSTPEDSRG